MATPHISRHAESITSNNQTNSMAGTRSSARLSQSSPESAKTDSGTKRKADDSSPSGKKAKQQKTLEETLPAADTKQDTVEEHAETTNANGNGKRQLSPTL